MLCGSHMNRDRMSSMQRWNSSVPHGKNCDRSASCCAPITLRPIDLYRIPINSALGSSRISMPAVTDIAPEEIGIRRTRSSQSRAPPDRIFAWSIPMMDVVMIAIAFVFFALSIAYVYACDQL